MTDMDRLKNDNPRKNAVNHAIRVLADELKREAPPSGMVYEKNGISVCVFGPESTEGSIIDKFDAMQAEIDRLRTDANLACADLSEANRTITELREQVKAAGELAEDYPELAKAVDWFTSEMRAKLLAKADQGYEGWDDPEYITGQWRDQTLGHVIRLMLDGDAGQAVDVANLAMFYAAFRKAQEDVE